MWIFNVSNYEHFCKAWQEISSLKTRRSPNLYNFIYLFIILKNWYSFISNILNYRYSFFRTFWRIGLLYIDDFEGFIFFISNILKNRVSLFRWFWKPHLLTCGDVWSRVIKALSLIIRSRPSAQTLYWRKLEIIQMPFNKHFFHSSRRPIRSLKSSKV